MSKRKTLEEKIQEDLEKLDKTEEKKEQDIDWSESLIIKDEQDIWNDLVEKDVDEVKDEIENGDDFSPVSNPTLSYVKIDKNKDVDVISAIVTAPTQKSKPANKNAVRGVYNLNGKIGKN
jgi:hypothetical protein